MNTNNCAIRLREEVERIGIGPVAEHLGVHRNTVSNRLKSGNMPLDELERLTDIGVDIGYVVTGQKVDIAEISAKSSQLKEDILDIDLLIEAVTLARSTNRKFTDEQFAELVAMIYVYIKGDDNQIVNASESKILQFADIAERRRR